MVGVAAGAMLDRVRPGLGRIGPVGDSRAMAENIVATLAENRARATDRAVAEAGKFDWDRIMGQLFGSFYPRAIERRAEVQQSRPEAVPAS